jgi:cytochrome b561
MPRSETTPAPANSQNPATQDPAKQVYSSTARAFHWSIALLVLITAPIGFQMAERGRANIWDATTNTMYSSHKLIGLIILALMIARLTYRLMHGAPASYPTLTTPQKAVSHAVHWSLYALLIAVPIGGYLGISYFPALDIFGVKIPGLVTPNEATAKQVLAIHGIAATALIGLIALHLGGAAYHLIIKGDGVVGRMWLRARKPD